MTDTLYFGATARLNYQPNTHHMHLKLLRRLSSFFCLALVLLGLDYRALGQLSVGPSGLAPQTFNSLPPASQWSMGSIGPRVAGGVFLSGPQLDGAVQTNSTASVNITLGTSSVVPPAADGYANWNSAGQYLQTRPNTNWYTLLMATLRNDTGSNVAFITVAYDLATVMAVGVNAAEEIPGHRVYFSLTGAAGSWTRIPQLDSTSSTENAPKSAIVNVGSWAPSATLYLLWADPNALAATAGASQEGGYTIDNFAVSIPAQTGPPNIVSQPQSQTVGYPNSGSFIVGAIGTTPLSYQWYKGGVAIPGATSPVYSFNNVTTNAQGSYYVVVSNALGTATSSNAVLTVTCAGGTATPIITNTNQPADQSMNAGGTLSVSVTASGSPVFYQWYKSGSLIPGATSATYTKAGAQGSDSGIYSALVGNCSGQVFSRGAVVSITDPPYVLMGLTNYVWKYNQGSDLGTAWRGVSYNDSGWPSGRGLFAFEDNATLTNLINTTTDNGPVNNALPTHYYRTTFVLSNDPAAVTMVSTNYLDDGSVVYVNGVEAFRYNMPEGPVQYGTFAPAANPAGEGTVIVSNIPSRLLKFGTNVIAVEVHQNGSGSSDNVFGMILLVTPLAPGPLDIVGQPQSITIEDSHPAAFTVEVSGAPAFYQWYKDGAPILNATANPFTIPSTGFSNAGIYTVVVSNFLNSVTSSPALLAVVSDTNRPVLLEADGTRSPTTVWVSFDYNVLLSTATNVANYRVTNSTGSTLTISSAVLTNGSNVLLTTSSPRLVNNNYLVIVNNVRDTSTNQNFIAPNSMYPIRTLVNLVGFESFWRFLDPYPPFDPSPASLGTAWKEFVYDTAGWADGQAVFYNGNDPGDVSGATINTVLSQTPVNSSYFRAGLQLQASPGGLKFLATHLIDDGAVFYLNGTEFYRFNMPDGVIVSNTRPTSIVGNVVLTGPVELPVFTTRSGSNVLAVELHQDAAPDLDKVFSVKLDASVQSFLVGPVIIASGPSDLYVVEGQPATFQVAQVGGAAFLWQSNNNPAWISGATNYFYTIPRVSSTMNNSQFRVGVSNSVSGWVMSTNATLRVVADTNPPTVVSAVIGSNNTIVISFSEPMAAAAANNKANYAVTNAAGGVANINTAVVNGTNVTLSFTTPLAGQYTVVMNNLTDTATIPNVIAANSSVIVGANYFIPFASAWKYLLINTNPTIQASFMQTNFNDSSWSGPSNALLYVEDATLPGPKNTLLSLFAASQQERINVFYFRQAFVAPIGGTNITMQIRHIIDDGIILYLNGAEILRFNMPATAPTASSQASGALGDAALVGPVSVIISNLPGGTNIFAAELHQNGTASSDMTFGIEMSFGIPSTVIPPSQAPQIVLQPRNQTNAAGTTATFNVVATGTGPLTYQWRKNLANISGVNNPSALTSTLSLPAVQLTDNGSSYSVVVSGPGGSVTSSAATLTVPGGPSGPTLFYTRLPNNGLQLFWTNPVGLTFTLQHSLVLSNITNGGVMVPTPWAPVTTSSPYTNAASSTNSFYRLVSP